MFFKIPTTVYFEKDCIFNHRKELSSLGNKALIVSGKHASYINGSFDDTVNALKNQNIDYEIFDEVEQNPSTETIKKAYDRFKNSNIDFIIALGGGSAMDSAKAIAVMLYYNIDNTDRLFEKVDEHLSLPVVAVATTCGTGSEVTAASVLTNNKLKTKMSMSYRIFPKYALIDSKYLKTLPKNTIKLTALDALGHLIESYISSKVTYFSDMITEEGLRVWSKNKKILSENVEMTDDDYDRLMLASIYGGMAIAHCGTNLPHGLSYTLTYNENIPHGKAVGYFLYGLIKYADKNRVEQLLDLLDFIDLSEFKNYLLPVFDLDKVDDAILDKAVDELFENKNKLSYCPYEVNKELLRKVAYSLWSD